MRRFTDAEGAAWDAVLGRESWGTLFAIFVPVQSGPAVRQTPLSAQTVERGAGDFDDLDDDELRSLFDRSMPKPL
ncbi:MAG: hypothetical protein KJO11_13295 [Gemmatimonadetes bacterium]|nr:hypothetical protein [Gemmatimonadota bacterium]NNK61570.1 hypothetical protein [Gemmatimonadota bacterium]